MKRSILAATLLLTSVVSAHADQQFDTSAGPVVVEAVAGPFQYPWAVAFLPEPGAMIVTEQEGTLRVVRNGEVSDPVRGLPPVRARGQGGLLDVAVAPDFAETQQIYWTFSEPVSGRKARTALARGVLDLNAGPPALTDVSIVFRQEPALSGGRHFGSRIVFNDDGTLFVTLGDRGNREMAQDPNNHIGKVVRLNRDGSVPDDNPFVGQNGVRPEIWSIGHRNAQGATRRADGTYFTISHGARGGDEVNQPRAGLNYGWPTISYGRHYSGGRIGVGTTAEGMEQPLFYWDPSIAPSGATIYEADRFPQWQGNLFVGALKNRLISRLKFHEDGRITEEERLLADEFGRIRDVRTGPDGAIYFVTDESNSHVYRIRPAG